MSDVSPEVHAALFQLLTSLTSADNQVRSTAEQSLNEEWIKGGQDRRDLLLLGLVDQSVHGNSETVRSFSAVLFRTISLRLPPDAQPGTQLYIFDMAQPQVQAQIRQMLIQGFLGQQHKLVRHKIADAISSIAKPWNEEHKQTRQWPELLPMLMEAIQNQDSAVRESAFRILATVPEVIGPDLIQQSVPAFERGFKDPEETVRISAVGAFTNFFQELDKKTWPILQGLLPQLLEVLNPLREGGKDYELSTVLVSLIDLIELAPKMFKGVFKQLIEFCITVAQDKDMEKARLSALEVATTFVDEAPNMCKNEPAYAEQMIMQCLKMMTEVGEDDEDAAEWNNEDDINDSDENDEAYSAAKQSLDRLALKLGGQVMLEPLFKYLPSMINSQHWRERHAALMALSNVAEGCRDEMIPALSNVLDMIVPLLKDSHSRVQWATCNALGQISTDFADNIQRNFGHVVIPALISKLNNESTPRVQAHAAAAMVNFSESASKEVLEPHLDSLLTSLLELLKSPKRYVQEQVLTTIAMVADAAEQKFSKYYDTLMNLLFGVMQMEADKEYRLLKAKSIECATLIALAVGEEQFSKHAEQVIQVFAQIQNSIVDDDDPCQSYLQQGWGRLCRVIGVKFLPCLEVVMPPLLRAAKHKADLQLLDDDNQVEELNQQDGWEIIPVQGKYIGIRTSLLDEKANAIDLLSLYACQLGAEFYPYVREIIQEVVVPSLNFFYHDGVRYSAAQAAASLLTCVQQHIARQNGGNIEMARKDPEVLELWVPTLKKMLEVLPIDGMVEVQAGFYSAIYQCAESIGQGSLNANDMQDLVNAINVNLDAYIQRAEERTDDNDEYAEEIDEEDAEAADEELLGEISKVIHVAFKITKADFLPYFDNLGQKIRLFLASNNDDCRHWALCVVDDLIEYTGPESWGYREVFLQPMSDSLLSGDAAVRQVAAYGIGVAAQHGGQEFGQTTISALSTLFSMASVPDARSEDNVHATENASAAIAKILRKNGSMLGNDLNRAVAEWIKTLPIVADDEAAPFAYMFLADLIEQSHEAVTSQVPKVFEVVAQALVHSSIQGRTAERVVAATKTLLGTLDQSSVMAMFQTLPQESQPVVQRWFQ